ncbi:MAG: hypothetical protein AABW83_01125 [Nanoarchaeota archaeon]
MNKKLAGLSLIVGLVFGGAGDYFIRNYLDSVRDNNVDIKEEVMEDSKLVGTLKLRIDEIPYLPVGTLNAYDERGISYEIFYNSLEGSATIRESKIISDNSSISDNKEISF